MIFSKKSVEPTPEVVYSYSIFPDMVPDGEHVFDGIIVSFSKPGWQWLIYEHKPNHEVPGVHAIGEGFPTRDAALVDLLKVAKELNGSQE